MKRRWWTAGIVICSGALISSPSLAEPRSAVGSILDGLLGVRHSHAPPTGEGTESHRQEVAATSPPGPDHPPPPSQSIPQAVLSYPTDVIASVMPYAIAETLFPLKIGRSTAVAGPTPDPRVLSPAPSEPPLVQTRPGKPPALQRQVSRQPKLVDTQSKRPKNEKLAEKQPIRCDALAANHAGVALGAADSQIINERGVTVPLWRSSARDRKIASVDIGTPVKLVTIIDVDRGRRLMCVALVNDRNERVFGFVPETNVRLGAPDLIDGMKAKGRRGWASLRSAVPLLGADD